METISDMHCATPSEMMCLLMKNPEHQERVFNLLNLYNQVVMNEKNICTNVLPGSNFISEDIKTESDQMKMHGLTQVVMSPFTLPVGKPAYAMNAIADSKPPVPTVAPVAVPAENNDQIFIDIEETNVSGNDITVDTSSDHVINVETVSSNNITLSADEISLCKKAQLCHDIVEPINEICSDQSEIRTSDANQLYTFCDRIISPEYIFCESQNTQVVDGYFENSIASSTYSLDNLMTSPEYALPPKTCSIISRNSEWKYKGEMTEIIGSPGSSICGESDSENDALDSWNNLKDLQLFMNSIEFSLSPSSTVYNVDEASFGDMHSSPGLPLAVDLADDVEALDPMSPEILADVELTDDENDVELPCVDKVPLTVKHPIPICVRPGQGIDVYKQTKKLPVVTDREHSCHSTNDTRSKLLSNVHADRNFLLENIDDSDPLPKRRKLESTQSSINQGSHNDSAFYGYAGVKCIDKCGLPDLPSVIKDHPVFKRDKDGDMALHISVVKGDVESTKILLQIMNGQQLDAQNNQHQTPLHLACYAENISCVELLLLLGADPEIVDGDGNNIMHIGCLKGSIEIIDLLLEYHKKDPFKIMAMLNTWNYEGYTPLHIASMQKDLKIIDELLELNCNVDAKDMKTGTTSLVYAVKNHDWELAKYLIVNGANINVPTNAGMYPLDYVALTSNLVFAQDLISRNAESGAKCEFTNLQMKDLFDSELRKRRRKRNRDARKQ